TQSSDFAIEVAPGRMRRSLIKQTAARGSSLLIGSSETHLDRSDGAPFRPDPSLQSRAMAKSYRFPKNPRCIYCQTRPGTTVDHVFARAFFGSVQPGFSMKAPSCREC